MALVKVPWATGNMAENTHGLARQAFFDSTGGAEGISSVGALKVQAQSVPNNTVRVAPGGAILNNRYDMSLGQSYGARNASQTSVTITATGSAGGRTDAILLRILDPEFEGQPPADPNDFDYTRLVAVPAPAGITRIDQLNLTYPAILLARVTIPANTGTITNAMITDLRELASPKSRRRVYPVRINTAGVEELSGVNGEYWPNIGGVQNIAVPEWATHMNVVCTWAQVLIPANSNPFGTLTLRFGPWDGTKNKYETQYVSFDALAGSNVQRTSFILPANRGVPADIRGTTQPFVLFGANTSASPVGKRAKLDTGSAVYMDIEFLQVAE